MKTKILKLSRTLTIALAAIVSFQSLKAEEAVVDTINVEEVVVKVSKVNSKLKNIPQKIEIITSEDIKQVPNQNLAEVIKRTTNLDIIQYPGLSATIGMRGFSPSAHSRSYTLILIDGKPSGTRNLASIATNSIERVEVVKGPYATLYGSDAMGGVINIITKKGTEEFSGNVSIEKGSFKTTNFEAFIGGKIAERLKFNTSFSRKNQGKDYKIGDNNFLNISDAQEIVLDKKSYGARMENTQWELSSFNAGLQAEINSSWNANAQVTYTFADEIETPGNFWGSYGQSLKDINRLNLYAGVERKTENNTLSFSPFFTKEVNSNYSNNTADGFISFEDNIREYGFKLQDLLHFGDVKAILGVDLGTYDYQSKRWSDARTPAAPYKPNNKNVNTAIFTQFAYNISRLDINAGLRYDHYSYQIDANEDLNAEEADENYNTLNTSLGLQYRIIDNLKFHTSFGTAFSVPDAYKVAGKYDVSVYFPDWDYWWSQSYVGNPDLDPEKSSTIDFGLKYSALDQALNLDVTYFNTVHKDKIAEMSLESGEKTYTNADKSKMDGLELASSFDFGVFADRKFKLELYSNWTFMFKSELEFDVDGGTEVKDMLFVRKSSGSFGLQFDNLKGLSSRLNARYTGNRLETDSFSGIRTDYNEADYYTEKDYETSDKIIEHEGALIFDYTLGYQFRGGFSVGASVNNLMDENYTEKDGYNMPGRSFLAKVSFNF